MFSSEKVALYVAGSNGSGKSTLISSLYNSGVIDGFAHINPDIILRDNNWSSGRKGYIKAYREADKRVAEALNDGRNFVRESVTMSPRKIKEIKDHGYEIYIMFIGTNDSNINILNVAQRVRMGGHSIPIETIIDRHDNAVKNVQQALPYAKCLIAFDNSYSGIPPKSCLAISSNAICFEDVERLKETKWLSDFVESIGVTELDEEKASLCRLLQEKVDANFMGCLENINHNYIDFSANLNNDVQKN